MCHGMHWYCCIGLSPWLRRDCCGRPKRASFSLLLSHTVHILASDRMSWFHSQRQFPTCTMLPDFGMPHRAANMVSALLTSTGRPNHLSTVLWTWHLPPVPVLLGTTAL